MARSNRRRRGTSGHGRTHSPRSLDDLVLPDGKCGRKFRFATKEKAAKALRQAKARRPPGDPHTEKRTYKCKRCDGWHLTSREFYDERGTS